MNEVKVWHPSEVWEWFKDQKRHDGGGNGFIAFPDYKKLQGQLNEIKNFIDGQYEIASNDKVLARELVLFESIKILIDNTSYNKQAGDK